MMYHDALCTTARRLGIGLEVHDRGEEVVRAADRLTAWRGESEMCRADVVRDKERLG